MCPPGQLNEQLCQHYGTSVNIPIVVCQVENDGYPIVEICELFLLINDLQALP
jgi:hypothetical protein